MATDRPALADVYEAAGPTGEIDSRAGATIVTSLALLAFALAKPGPDIDILGMKFTISDARYIGFALLVSVLYSSAQLGVAWWVHQVAFALKYRDQWNALASFVTQRETERTSALETLNLAYTNVSAHWRKRTDFERDLSQRIVDPRAADVDKAFDAYMKDPDNTGYNAFETANESWNQVRRAVEARMTAWDRRHPPPPTPDDRDLLRLLGGLRRDDLADAAFISRVKWTVRLINMRGVLELLVPFGFAAAAIAVYGR